MRLRIILTYITAAMIAAWLAAGCGVVVPLIRYCTVTSSIGTNIIVGSRPL